MNHPLLVFLGVFLTLAFSWVTLIFGAFHQLGNQSQTAEVGSNRPYPVPTPGRSVQGLEVYRAEGCVTCHSQQIQPGAYEADQRRGWGKRRSVARDYMYGQTFQIGHMRMGPDLANVGSRLPENFAAAWKTAIPELQTNNIPTPEERIKALSRYEQARQAELREWHFLHLYNPQITAPGSVMPSYAHLFHTRRMALDPSPNALRLVGKFAPKEGYEVLPTEAGQALVDYLMGQFDKPYLFEAPNPVIPKPVREEPEAAEGTNGAPAKTNAPAGTAAAPQ